MVSYKRHLLKTITWRIVALIPVGLVMYIQKIDGEWL